MPARLKYFVIYLLFIIITLINLCNCGEIVSFGEVIYAINAGGEALIDSHGVRYERDPLYGKVGTASDYGKRFQIKRVNPEDQVLYQTERYHYSSFGYDIPVEGDGDYVMVLKFCEVYFEDPNMKVFDVRLNGMHDVISNLDIFKKVGHGAAHDVYIVFSIVDGKLLWEGEESEIRNNKIYVEFVKGDKDNPKINAIYVAKAYYEDIPKLIDENEVKPEISEDKKEPSARHVSGPKHADPYSVDSKYMLPVFFSLAAFMPLLLLLCRM